MARNMKFWKDVAEGLRNATRSKDILKHKITRRAATRSIRNGWGRRFCSCPRRKNLSMISYSEPLRLSMVATRFSNGVYGSKGRKTFNLDRGGEIIKTTNEINTISALTVLHSSGPYHSYHVAKYFGAWCRGVRMCTCVCLC